MRIGTRSIGRDFPPFIIAEMSGNHNHSLDRALDIVRSAAESGAHALKIQTYTPDTMTIDLNEREFRIEDPNSQWTGRSLYDLYHEAHLPWEWHHAIFELATQLGMIVFSTPFDDTSVDFLEELDVPCYKIASFENTDIALIRRVSETGKPVIISCGMATLEETQEAVDTAKEAGCSDLILLKCTSTYPATPGNSNISTIPHMRETFGCEVGLSDHTGGIGVAVASVAMGATVVEKHFTLDRNDGGVDASFSLEPNELRQLVVETERAWRSIGQISYGASRAEQNSLQFRRSLYIVKDVDEGTKLTNDNVQAIRPGFGLPTRHLGDVLGRRIKQAAPRGTPLSWELLD